MTSISKKVYTYKLDDIVNIKFMYNIVNIMYNIVNIYNN